LLKLICGILNRGMASSFWNHIIQISSRQIYFQDIYSNLWKVKIFTPYNQIHISEGQLCLDFYIW
jgi:hypothetical protein